jgi:hypothetical protein
LIWSVSACSGSEQELAGGGDEGADVAAGDSDDSGATASPDDVDPGTDDGDGASANPDDGSMGAVEPDVEPNAGPLYLKASNTGAADRFGVSVAFSSDGNTLVVGANRESSSVEGGPDDDSVADAGAVYVFSRNADTWEQTAFLKASNSGLGDGFGSFVAVSADGNTLAVGAPFESSAATGIDGEQNDDSEEQSGAVYVFERSDGAWAQRAYIKASNGDDFDQFGAALALSADGNTLVVGAEGEDGASTGVDGDQTDKSAWEAGAVYVFQRTGDSWQQESYVKPTNTDARDHFGVSVALSEDASVLAVGAYYEDSISVGVDGDQTDNGAPSTGAVYVFEREAASWVQQTYLKPAQNDGYGYDNFGAAVSLAADGNTLAVGAPGDNSAAAGVDGDPNSGSMALAGAAYVFGRDGDSWQQQAYVKPSNTGAEDEFGQHLSLSASGKSLLVGAAIEASAGTGIDGPQDDNSAPAAGAAFLFGLDAGSWQQLAYIKAPNADSGDRFGWSTALAADASVLAIGASRESGSATGIGGDQADDAAPLSGAVYVYPSDTAAELPVWE